MVVINLCQCVFPGAGRSKDKEDEADVEEAVALLEVVGPAKLLSQQMAAKKTVAPMDLMTNCNRSLDIFKGVLVIFMTWAHVDLTLMNPGLQIYGPMPHFVGNAASGLCFLGFMMAYGFSCDNAYLSDWKERTLMERLERLARSALMPVFGAWACACGWGFMCWKLPLTVEGLVNILDFRLSLGNGPDFLLCFTSCLLAMYPLRGLVNRFLDSESLWKRVACGAAMLLVPLALTRLVIHDCTGMKKYWGYILECDMRDPYSPVLPGLPHLFYFNLGVLLSRFVKSIAPGIKAGIPVDLKKVTALYIAGAAFLLVLAYPLYTVWAYNYGNLMVPSKWGPITRGFSDGPSVLWLVGNMFPIYICMGAAFTIHFLVERNPRLFVLLRFVLGELEHYGANVLMYLVVGDICLAGLWRGMTNEYPLDVRGCEYMTLALLVVVRFLHYLGASSRDGKAAPKSDGASAG